MKQWTWRKSQCAIMSKIVQKSVSI